MIILTRHIQTVIPETLNEFGDLLYVYNLSSLILTVNIPNLEYKIHKYEKIFMNLCATLNYAAERRKYFFFHIFKISIIDALSVSEVMFFLTNTDGKKYLQGV